MSGCTNEMLQMRLRRRQQLTERFVRDPHCDFLLYHPFFHQTFDVFYSNLETIPQSLDILSVEIETEEKNYIFQIKTAGERIGELLQRERHMARFGIYIDNDFNGNSELFLTTTDRPDQGLTLTYDFHPLEENKIVIEGNSISFYASKSVIGENFDWLAFSGFSPREGAFHPTTLPNVFFVPIIDVAYPRRRPRAFEIWTSHLNVNPCQVYESGFSTCPVPGAPVTNVPNLLLGATPQQGVMIHRIMCGGKGHELWCINYCFARRPFNGSWQGWIARCPYPNGNNFCTNLLNPNTKIMEKVIHTVYDGPIQYPQDTDSDNLFDLMEHTYDFGNNQVTSCNIELDMNTLTQKYKRCKVPQTPYVNYSDVPGSIGTSGTTGP